MAWTNPATPVSLTTVTVAFWNVNSRDNLNVLRANTGSGDPTTDGQIAIATGAGVTAWSFLRAASVPNGLITDAMLAAGIDADTVGGRTSGSGPGQMVFRDGAGLVDHATFADTATNWAGAGGRSVGTTAGEIAFYNGGGRVVAAALADIATSADTAASASDSAALGGVAAASYLQKSGAATLSSPNWTIGGVMTLGAGQVNFGGNVDISGNCVVHGFKPRCATGRDGNHALWYANETPIPVFEDFGRTRTVDGMAIVPIDPGAANYLALDDADYHVYLTAEGAARPYVAGRTATSFTVRVLDGEPDISFVWRLMAVQGDMGHIERNLPLWAAQAIREDGL